MAVLRLGRGRALQGRQLVRLVHHLFRCLPKIGPGHGFWGRVRAAVFFHVVIYGRISRHAYARAVRFDRDVEARVSALEVPANVPVDTAHDKPCPPLLISGFRIQCANLDPLLIGIGLGSHRFLRTPSVQDLSTRLAPDFVCPQKKLKFF